MPIPLQQIPIRVGAERFAALACGPEHGRLVLCLHGFPDLPSTWAPVMERLSARGYRCVAPFMRGYAPSTTRGPFHADRLGADVVAIARELSPREPVSVLGHDWGAIAAVAALAREPERFTAAVTVAVPHLGQIARALVRRPALARRLAYLGFMQLPGAPVRALEGDLVDRLWRRWSPGFEPPLGHLAAVRETLRESRYAPLACYRALPVTMLRCVPRWPRIRVPTLHLHGLDDGCVPAALGAGQARYFASPSRTELLVAGHFAPLELPDRVAELALRWLGRHGPCP